MTAASPGVRGPSWSAVAPASVRTAAGATARLGAYCWVEQRLFGLLGGWVVDIAEPDAKALVAEHAEHAAWRAQRWFELLPTAPPGADALVVAPPGVDTVLDDLGWASGARRTPEKLAVAHRILLPRLLAAYTAHQDWAEPVSEPAAVRMLGVAVDDLVTDLRHGERLLEALLATAGDEEATVDHEALGAAVGRLEAALVGVGGLVGPGSVGSRPATG